MSTKKTKSTQRQSAARQKGSASKNISVKKAGYVGKSKAAGTKTKFNITVKDRTHVAKIVNDTACAAEPVVYQTLRERVNAVNDNVGKTQTLSDFLKSRGW